VLFFLGVKGVGHAGVYEDLGGGWTQLDGDDFSV